MDKSAGKKKIWFLLLLSALFLNACDNTNTLGDEDPLDVVTTNARVNTRVHGVMNAHYLWLDELKKLSEYRINQEPELFFETLISDNEKKTSSSGYTYYYSYIQNNNTTKAMHTKEDTYGIEFIAYRIINSQNEFQRYELRVMYVLPGSPAEKSGVKRGHWIYTIDGNYLNTVADVEKIYSGSNKTLQVFDYGNLTVDSEGYYQPATFTVNLQPSIQMYDNPILKDTIFELPTCNMGYVAYNHFTTGPDNFENSEYDNHLTQIFSGFKSQNVSKLIVDLRYNPGGYLYCAQHFASLISHKEHVGNVFSKVIRNPKSPYQDSFYYITDNEIGNLNIDEVYFIITEFTASASEALINGLKPFSGIDVKVVGTRSEGKNLASNNFANDELLWEIQPIVGKVSNMNDESNYSNGISPDYVIDEFDTSNYGLYWGELGTTDDIMINLIVQKFNGEEEEETRATSGRYSGFITKDAVKSVSSLDSKKFNSVIVDTFTE